MFHPRLRVRLLQLISNGLGHELTHSYAACCGLCLCAAVDGVGNFYRDSHNSMVPHLPRKQEKWGYGVTVIFLPEYCTDLSAFSVKLPPVP